MTAISKQRTVNSEQSTANSQQQTANSKQRTANSQLSTVNRQLTTECSHRYFVTQIGHESITFLNIYNDDRLGAQLPLNYSGTFTRFCDRPQRFSSPPAKR
ncbi:MAG: hypothetical protein EAZ78_06735 [Oscillatoriales cyanobacterium]|nr:MAG: hypothetical protein EA000_09630 [Oscillatoriales cyanobacterium]TAD98848.1 MAG: hypothetical protein EAZ98_05525 [Oscillatoriales cyanobacterium]TAE06866.1 MAG: hypothetical protein EAZ96_01120 [Oscillatoriales cyanobacterium]TAF05025.1 MAG: hypothetical protein EAZ78_06735 [Oscillatoriales cyanobacterium]TAF66716.1 MAG: hypothetical protein EAZ59_13445 [Oscillatoriales cyanobacterium]